MKLAGGAWAAAGVAARWTLGGTLTLLAVVAVLEASRVGTALHASGAAVVTVAVGLLPVARGTAFGRPITRGHACWALLPAVVAVLASERWPAVAVPAALVAGWVLMWPAAAPPGEARRPQIAALVSDTRADPLAPFVLHSGRAYHLSASGRAAVGFRVRLGMAVVGGDPVGDRAEFPALIDDFAGRCRRQGWRICVLGASEALVPVWQRSLSRLAAVPIGRDVVLPVADFEPLGRRFRNLRQAVNRARNAGVTVRIASEAALTAAERAELAEVMAASGRRERGFSMILDGMLSGRTPGAVLAIATDRLGRVTAFHRYLLAGGGGDVSLDLPYRRPGTPNGTDELLTITVLDHVRRAGAQRMSLSFAAFPELFESTDRRGLQRLLHWLLHRGDALIRLESLYGYLRKYHALAGRRLVLLRWTQLPIALAAMLTLEFGPSRPPGRRHPTDVRSADPA